MPFGRGRCESATCRELLDQRTGAARALIDYCGRQACEARSYGAQLPRCQGSAAPTSATALEAPAAAPVARGVKRCQLAAAHALARRMHSRIITRVDCSMPDCRKSSAVSTEKVRIRQLHIVAIGLRRPRRAAAARSPCCTSTHSLTPHAFAAAGARMLSELALGLAGEAARTLRAAEPKWAWFSSARAGARRCSHPALWWCCTGQDGGQGAPGDSYARCRFRSAVPPVCVTLSRGTGAAPR